MLLSVSSFMPANQYVILDDRMGRHLSRDGSSHELWWIDCCSVLLGFRKYLNISQPAVKEMLTSIKVEAAYFPGCLYYLSCWYTRKELGLRTAFLYSGALISGAFSGLISAGITGNMDGVRGYGAWQW